MFAGFLDEYRASWAAFDDARPALEVARGNGWRIGVLTNGSTVQQNAKLVAIGLAELVDVVSHLGEPSGSASRRSRRTS